MNSNNPYNSIFSILSEVMNNNFDSNFIFDEEVNNKWLNAFNLLGVDPSKLSNHSGTA